MCLPRTSEQNAADARNAPYPSNLHVATQITTMPLKLKIIAFSDINYAPLAEMWYDSLTRLGYTDHVLVALDTPAFDQFKAGNRRAEQCAERDPTAKVGTIWGLRLRYEYAQAR